MIRAHASEPIAISLAARRVLRGRAEGAELTWRQGTSGAHGEIAEADRPEGRSSQAHDAMAERLAVALDLVVAALGEGQAQAARPAPRAQQLDGERHRGTIVELRALAPPRQRRPRDAALDVGLVDPGDLVARMEQAVRQRAVVGQEEHTLDVDVETANGKEPHVSGHQIRDDGPPLRILARADVAGWLVEQQVLPRLGRPHALAVEPHVVDVGIGQRPRLAHDDAVDGDAAVEDEAVSSPA